MSDSRSHSTLRELREHFTRPATLVVLAGLAAILTLMAPYGTEDFLRPAPRFVYWLVMVAATYGAGSLTGRFLARRLSARISRVALIILIGVATGIAVAFVVILVNLAAVGYLPSRTELPSFALNIFGIAMIITILLQVLEGHLEAQTPAQAETSTAPAPPPILDRIPLEKRDALISLSVEDHYVRVRTLKGEEVILQRLSDAMNEVGATPGLQVHRSHWVATDQVTAARREGDRAVLSMTQGEDIPVSRRYVPAIKEAGLLPR